MMCASKINEKRVLQGFHERYESKVIGVEREGMGKYKNKEGGGEREGEGGG